MPGIITRCQQYLISYHPRLLLQVTLGYKYSPLIPIIPLLSWVVTKQNIPVRRFECLDSRTVAVKRFAEDVDTDDYLAELAMTEFITNYTERCIRAFDAFWYMDRKFIVFEAYGACLHSLIQLCGILDARISRWWGGRGRLTPVSPHLSFTFSPTWRALGCV